MVKGKKQYVKISIIMPTYNRAFSISKSIDSVFEQTFKDFELIIVDDGSTDNTKETIALFLEKYPEQVKYIYQKNAGAASARNNGLLRARGQYVSFLDSDDLWAPDFLEKLLEFMEKYNFDWTCCCAYRDINKEGKNERTILRIDPKYLEKDGIKINLLKHGIFSFKNMPIFMGTVLLKKNCFDTLGLFDKSYVVGEDSDMWLRLEEHGYKGGFLNEPLFFYNKNETSLTSDSLLGLSENLRLAKKHIKLIDCDKTTLKKSYSYFLWEYAGTYWFHKKYIYSIFLCLKSFFIYAEKEKLLKIKRQILRCFGFNINANH